MRHFFTVLAALLLSSAANAETWAVAATLTDGSELKGTVSVASFKLESSLGTLDMRMEQVVSVTMEEGRAVVKLRDGSSLAGKSTQIWQLATSVGVVNVSPDRLKVLTVTGKATPETPAGPGQGAPPPANPPKVTGSTIPAPAEDLKAVVSDVETVFAVPMFPIRGGAALLAYDATNARVLTLDPVTMKAGPALGVSIPPFSSAGLADAPSWSLSPSGRRVWVACGRKISIVDVEGMKELKSFAVEADVLEVVAITDDLVLARQVSSTTLITSTAQGPTRSWQRQAALNPTPDRRKIMTDQGTFLLAQDGTSVKWDGQFAPRGIATVDFSGDGRWAASSTGMVFRVGTGSVAELAALGYVPASVCRVFLADSKSLVLFTREGTLEVRRAGTWESTASYSLGRVGHLGVVSPTGRTVWAVLSNSSRPPTGRYAETSRLAGPGKVFRLTLPEK